MRRWQRIVLFMIALLLLAAGAAALFGPDLLRDRARSWVRAETGRALEIGKVSVNLLALSIEIRNLSLSEAGRSTPFVAWERLYVALSPRSLWHRAPVIRRISLDKPTVRIEHFAEGRYNFSDLLKGAEDAPAGTEQAREPLRFSLNNLEIHDGRIEFIDRTLPAPVTHRVEKLALAIPFVGNLPYLADRYVEPLLRASVNGTPFELKGNLKPFTETPEYTFGLQFAGIDLRTYLGYLPEHLPVTVNGGRLDLDLDLAYRASADAAPVLELAGRLGLTALDLRERGGRPLLFLPLLETRLAPSRPLQRDFHLASLTLLNPQLWIARNPVGAWNVANLGGGPSPAEAPPAETAKDTPPLQLRIDRLQLTSGRLELRDQLPAGGFATIFAPVNFTVNDFTLAEGTPFRVDLAAASARQEQLTASGQITARPFALDLHLDAKGLPLAAYQPYYQTQTTAAIGGTIDVGARLQSNSGQPLLISEARLAVHNLELPLNNGEGLRLTSADLRGGSLDLAANRLVMEDLALSDAALKFSRDKSGRWSFHDRNYPLLAELAAPVAAGEAPAEPEGKPFSWQIGQLSLRNAQLHVRDELPAEPVQIAVTGLGATVRNLAAPEKVPASFEVQGNFQQRGQFQADGTVIPAAPEITGNLQLRRIPLNAFAPYLAEHIRLVLVDGALDTRLTVSAAKRQGEWQGRFGGSAGISRFYCLDADHREDLLRWERLQVNGIDGRIAPFSLNIAGITLNDYYARVLLDEQSRLNFAELAVKKPAGAGDAPAAPADAADAAGPAVPEPPGATSPKPEIRIGKITLQGGKVNFTDRHLARPFSAEMLQLGGRIEGLSSQPGTRAEIDLRGRLRNESPLSVAGTLNPLADPLFLDIRLDFTDIELSPLSPYAGTYVGYLIERGKLNVALAYLVENGRLQSSNKLFFDQFTFGAKVESDKATALPVRLAVALLKDRNGEIHLDIPVSGDLNDPQFSVWGVVWQIVRNLLVKAVTSPLALLGALAGGGEDFSAIVFPFGSTALTDTELSKVKKIAEALRERTDLKIEVRGFVDPDNDPEGYRRELLEGSIRRAKLLTLRKEQGEAAPADADAVRVTPAEYSAYLWQVYRDTDFPKPRNLVGLIKHLPDAELEKLLLANTRIGTEELALLAQSRARAVVAALVEAGIPRNRLFLAAPDMTAKPAAEGASRSRVEFSLAID